MTNSSGYRSDCLHVATEDINSSSHLFVLQGPTRNFYDHLERHRLGYWTHRIQYARDNTVADFPACGLYYTSPPAVYTGFKFCPQMAQNNTGELFQEAVFSHCTKSKDEKDDLVLGMVINQSDDGSCLRVIESNL